MTSDASISTSPRAEAASVHASSMDVLLRPLHRWVWSDARRRAMKLLQFAETEADGGRDIARAAERTSDPLLRRLYLRHAMDEQRHAAVFRTRGRGLLAELPATDWKAGFQGQWLSPGERGLDALQIERETEESLLAFLHLSERAAACRFAVYQSVLPTDPGTRDVFIDVLNDEAFHMSYTLSQLKRISPKQHGVRLVWARLARLWKGYLRIASAIANVMGTAILTVQYFVLLPLFALLAKRSARRELPGWVKARGPESSLRSQY